VPLLTDSEIREIIDNTVLKGNAAGWSDAKLRRRIKWKIRLAKAWLLGKKIPFRPFGGAIAGVGEITESVVKDVVNDDG